MSEYQSYAFQAIDRRLTDKEMRELRSVSSRGRITPTSFTNEYSWGDFKGSPDVWMEKYFDAFLYLANWGTHIFKLRLPARLLDLSTARLYCVGDSVSAREKNGNVILHFGSDDEEGGGWIEDDEDSEQLASLIPVRSDLARGDLRALYLGWLLCAQSGELGEDDMEPPVPAGLSQLDGALESFADFLRIDRDLIDAAAATSAPLGRLEPEPAELREWIATLPLAEKDELLARVMVGDPGSLASELIQRLRREQAGDRRESREAATRRRTVAELLRAGEQAAAERERIAAEKAAKEKAQRERAAARARAKHLDELAGKEPMLWQKVESLVATKLPKSYDQAVDLLADLRDLAARKGEADFPGRVAALRTAHARKPTLISRLDKAGL